MSDEQLPCRDPQTLTEIHLLQPDLAEARVAFLRAEAAARSYAGTPGAKEFVLDWLRPLMDRGCDLQEDFSG